MLKDIDYDFGPGIGTLKMYSLQHLRCQNLLSTHTPEQLLKRLEKEEYLKIPLAIRLAKRLEDFSQKFLTDRKLIEAIVMDGHWRGLGSSPYHSDLADIYWQSAALLLEQYGVEHINELTQLPD